MYHKAEYDNLSCVILRGFRPPWGKSFKTVEITLQLQKLILTFSDNSLNFSD